MMYNDANGPTYQAVKNYVGKAVTHTEYSKVAGNFDILKRQNDLSICLSTKR